MTKRKNYSAEFKAKVALEAIRDPRSAVAGGAVQEVRRSAEHDQRLEEGCDQEHGVGLFQGW